MTWTQAYAIAHVRAMGCPTYSTAEAAWGRLAVRRQKRIAPLWCYSEALKDAQASERPDLVAAIRRIAAHQHGIAQRRRFPAAVVDKLAQYMRAELKPRGK